MQLVLVQPELSYEPGADNVDIVLRLLAPHAGALAPEDVVLLPEHFDLRASPAEYEAGIIGLARRLGCHVVGGSHHEDRDGTRVNVGVAADGRGDVIGAYEKLRPYADERSLVSGGGRLGEMRIGGRAVLVLICADFWFSDVFYRATSLPDLILVPAFSVSRKPTPDYSRALWRNLSVARAYEFGAYVGVSDWAHTRRADRLSASGVGGFADPTTSDPEALFRPIDGAIRIFTIDWDALESFRRDRIVRGFFWKMPETLETPPERG